MKGDNVFLFYSEFLLGIFCDIYINIFLHLWIQYFSFESLL